MSSDLCVRAMQKYYDDRKNQIGSKHPEAGSPVLTAAGNVLDLKTKPDANGKSQVIMDCITFVLKVLRDGYGYKELERDIKYKNGMDLSKHLVDEKNWEAHFWSPDVYRVSDNSQHTVGFLQAINAPKISGREHKPEALAYKAPYTYFNIALSGMIVGYNRLSPDSDVANITANQFAFDRLKKVKFCVGICRGGNHTFLMSYGKVWEVVWDQEGYSLYRDTDFIEYTWLSGIVITPPDSGFTSRPIGDIIAAIKKAEESGKKANSEFLCRINPWCK